MLIGTYSFSIFIVHFILSLILFFLINWIGEHSFSMGYMQLSIFHKKDEAPAFNFLLRVLSPVIYIFLVSTLFYYLKLEYFVINIYLVCIYYLVIRISFNLLMGRAKLLNWKEQSLTFICILFISYFSYKKIISERRNILPDFQTISNELWLIIMLFLYQVFNKVKFAPRTSIKRKDNYLISKYNSFNRKYGSMISSILKNKKLEAIVFSILIYESFNRPKAVRLIENFLFYLGKAKSLGVMQVQTTKILNDSQSVEIGTRKVLSDYQIIRKNLATDYRYSEEWILERKIIQNYNPSDKYYNEISIILRAIKEKIYQNINDRLTFIDSLS